MGLFDRIRDAFRPAPDGWDQRLAAIDGWLATLDESAARTLALPVLSNADWFLTERVTSDAEPPSTLPPSALRFFREFAAVTGQTSNLRFVAAEIQSIEYPAGAVRLGWADSHVQLCAVPGRAGVVSIAEDVPAADAEEGEVPTLWHAVLRAAAVLGHVALPKNAA